MLIDATHPEETRVVVLRGSRLEDFDIEVKSRKLIKGNIYLAKVTRVEPSLQAAFVDYGGNRHGFLAFNEIHPDYYQIPIADRERLVAEHENNAEADDDDGADEGGEGSTGIAEGSSDTAEGSANAVETVGGDDSEEVDARRRRTPHRNYKIQEVVKRHQILLVQAVKEERGNKGAALTTYISLAGRYCVLMPNTARGGGISRKISNSNDRKKLRTILNNLGIPKGTTVIVRTAGSKRTKAEINRDYEYLIRLWNTVRGLTLGSTAPCLVHEESNLIKRTIRDLYSNEIEEIVVDGEDSYRIAKDFMKLIIPSHSKRVQPYRNSDIPLFQQYNIEKQLDCMHSPEVKLKSGGYIVINPTEALVSIDVNSGRSTRQRNIEETALSTNLEASDEIARQIRLRDLSGLVVIDYIDMEASRNNSKVERRLKDAMRLDRARIQLGRISPFGLLELSRQRLRPSILETSSEKCPYCEGTGVRRSTESSALFVLRAIEEEITSKKPEKVIVQMPTDVALYILNYKHSSISDMGKRSGTTIILASDDTLIPPQHRIEHINPKTAKDGGDKKDVSGKNAEPASDSPPKEGGKRRRQRGRRRKAAIETATTTDNEVRDTPSSPSSSATGDGDAPTQNSAEPSGESISEEDKPEDMSVKRRRRGRRGGRRRGRKPAEQQTTVSGDTVLLAGPEQSAQLPPPDDTVVVVAPDGTAVSTTDAVETAAVKKPAARTRKRAASRKDPEKVSDKAAENDPVVIVAEEKPKRVRKPRRKAAAKTSVSAVKVDDSAASTETVAKAEDTAVRVEDSAVKSKTVDLDKVDKSGKDSRPAKKGWWRR